MSNKTKDELREILDTGTIIVNLTSSSTSLSMTGLSMTGQSNFTTHFGDDWGVTYKGKKISLQEFIETLLAEECNKARYRELIKMKIDWGYGEYPRDDYRSAEDWEAYINRRIKQLREKG